MKNSADQGGCYPQRKVIQWLSVFIFQKVIGSIICSWLHFWRHRFNLTKFFLNLVRSSWLWWIIHVVLTIQKQRNIWMNSNWIHSLDNVVMRAPKRWESYYLGTFYALMYFKRIINTSNMWSKIVKHFFSFKHVWYHSAAQYNANMFSYQTMFDRVWFWFPLWTGLWILVIQIKKRV